MNTSLLFLIVLAFVAHISADSCVQCNSKNEERCATDPLSFMARNCSNSSSLCYTRIINGYTVRGCASDLDESTRAKCNNEMECVTCSFIEGCNRLIFPQSRSKCLQCSGNSTNSSCASHVYEKATVCPIYKLGDKCFIRNSNRTAEGSFQRGCLTTANANKQCVKDGNCYTCGGDGCNFLLSNDTLIPLARDGSAVMMVPIMLLLASLVAGWML